jgi:hypothetical protein
MADDPACAVNALPAAQQQQRQQVKLGCTGMAVDAGDLTAHLKAVAHRTAHGTLRLAHLFTPNG